MGAPFISQQDLSDYIGRDVTADNGALIAVDAACEIVRVLCEQNFDLATETISIDGTGTDCLLLPELPALAAGTVTIGGSAITDYVLGDNGRLLRVWGTATPSWWLAEWGWWPAPWSLPIAIPGYASVNYLPPTPVWPIGRQNVQVTYDHGYGTADIPRAVRAVALSLAGRMVVQGAAISETVGAVSVRYAGAAMDLTGGEKAILRKFRPTR